MIYITKEYSFAYLPIRKKEKNTTKKIISSIYKDNIQIRKEEDFSVFHKVDPLLL